VPKAGLRARHAPTLSGRRSQPASSRPKFPSGAGPAAFPVPIIPNTVVSTTGFPTTGVPATWVSTRGLPRWPLRGSPAAGGRFRCCAASARRPSSLGSYRAAGATRCSAALSISAPRASSARSATPMLMGRGGAAFPTHIKVGRGRVQPGPTQVLGHQTPTSPSRVPSRTGGLMEADPYRARRGSDHHGLSLRRRAGLHPTSGRVPRRHEARLAHAVSQARAHGFLART